MAGSTFIQVPQNISDTQQLRRFLDKLVEQLDIAFGNRGDSAFVTSDSLVLEDNSLQGIIKSIQEELPTFSKLDGSRLYTGVVKYNGNKPYTTGSNEFIDVNYAETRLENKFNKNTAFNKNFGNTSGTVTEGGTTTYNPIYSPIVDLNQTISDPPTQAEVQAISNKIDDILVALRSSKIISI